MYKLEENKSYFFKPEKFIFIDDQILLAVIDPFGTKHFIETRHYENYDINLNKNILCFVDKINCKGQIFLEPDHPFYKRESIHDFIYSTKEERITKSGEKIKVIVVKDIYGRNCTILPNNSFQTSDKFCPEKIKCKVERVKKSIPYLINIDFTEK